MSVGEHARIAWHVSGHGPLSGDYIGHDQVGDFFRRTMDLSGGVFSIDVHNVLAECSASQRFWSSDITSHSI
jgi:hypothetical protein